MHCFDLKHPEIKSKSGGRRKITKSVGSAVIPQSLAERKQAAECVSERKQAAEFVVDDATTSPR